LVMTWLPLFLTSYHHRLLLTSQKGNLCVDTCYIQNRVTYVLAFTR
jgi:hypothetical protein